MTDFAPELYELPFDQFQRYAALARLVEALGVAPSARVLDVGGAPGPAERFLPAHATFVADLELHREGRYTRASGAALPFGDDTFDLVVSFDTLEHVPPGDREAFLAELRRTSADLVILAAPFSTPLVHLAEEAVMEFFEARQGYVHPILLEHRECGLPELAPAVESFTTAGWSVATLPSGFLPRWLGAMLVHEDLRARQLPDLSKLHAFYNRSVAEFDFREPGYRQIVVSSATRGADELQCVVGELESPTDSLEAAANVRAIVSEVFAQEMATTLRSGELIELEQRYRELDLHARDLERQLADREAHLMEVRIENERLRRRLTNRAISALRRHQ